MRRWCPMLVLAGLGAGCGSPALVEVHGVVQFKGKPLPDLLVAFVPEAEGKGGRALGRTDDAGKFTLHTEAGKPGAAPGSYRITVEDLDVNSAPRSPDGTLLKPFVPRIPRHFGDLLKTPLRREVVAGMGPVELRLERD